MGKPVPTINQCLQYIERYEMLANIRDHSFMVARVAKTLVEGLGAAAAVVPPTDEVLAGALLHDIAKTRCLNNNSHHAEDGQNICNELGHPEIGQIVVEHVILGQFDEDAYRNGIFGAKELVYYADKRVRHDQVVSLDDRLDYIIERYGQGSAEIEQRIRLNFSATKTLELFLFSHLKFSPEELTEYLADDIFTSLLTATPR